MSITNKSGENTERHVMPCPECQSGLMHLTFLTYFTWLNDELITVPNFPSWVCDLCGRRDYDNRAVTWLNTILNPETGRQTPRKAKLPPDVRQIHPKKPIYPD